jgi:hypothetical protein
MNDNLSQAIGLVYVDLLFKHHDAARTKIGSKEQKRYFKLINELRTEYPKEITMWEKTFSNE